MFYGTQKFIAVFTGTLHWTPPPTHTHTFSSRLIRLIYYPLTIALPFPAGSRKHSLSSFRVCRKNCITFLTSSTHTACPAQIFKDVPPFLVALLHQAGCRCHLCRRIVASKIYGTKPFKAQW
jgi:hypothetical protein